MSDKTERINLRCSAESVATLRSAAAVAGQDLTSFMLGASLDRARAVLAEDMFLKLTPAEMVQVEKALSAEAAVVPQLVRLFESAKESLNV